MKKRSWVAARFWCLIACAPMSSTGEAPAALPELLVLAERLSGQGKGAALAEWNREDLQAAAPRTLDELLARDPSFSLYRRQSALFGNPTSAGVSLRNTGATAASRTLVLLDGIPQNDPFGGWVYWARYDAAALESVRMVSSARAAVWGNQSPAGVIQMNAHAPFQERHVLKLGAGGQGTWSGSTVHQVASADQSRAFGFSAFGLRTDGFYALPRWQRGSVDRKLETELMGGDLKFTWRPARGLSVEPLISYYQEERGNGTALSGNSTEAVDLSLRVSSEDGERGWQALAWHQRREFDSVFSAVSPDRNSEVMSLDQFDVPARGTGGAFTWQWDRTQKWSILAGVDARLLRGETHENVGVFRQREAGGEQTFWGIFSALGYQLAAETRLDASLRLDAWELSEGRRLEKSLSTGQPLREEGYADRDGLEPSAALEIRHSIHQDLEWRGSLGSAFRLPTLNELHRPFRVRSDIVEANSDLDPERFVSLETGMDWQAMPDLELSVALFHHWISDAIANVPVTDAAEIIKIFGTIPPGGSGAQRRNVDEARVLGLQAALDWTPLDAWRYGLVGIWSETEFSESREQALLEGKPFPQAPELRVLADAECSVGERWTLFAGGEYGASQFDDALATRSIADYHSVRVGVSWRRPGAIYQARIENLFDEEIQTGLSSDGIRTLAGPRSLWVSAEWEF
jgi:outer membrane cobalamin receptor